MVTFEKLLVWQVFYFIGFFQHNTGSLERHWLHLAFTLYTSFLCYEADGVVLYSDKQKYEEQLWVFLISRGFLDINKAWFDKTLIMLERKNGDFNMFIANAVRYRFNNLMLKHHTMEKHGVNGSYQLPTVYKNECHRS